MVNGVGVGQLTQPLIGHDLPPAQNEARAGGNAQPRLQTGRPDGGLAGRQIGAGTGNAGRAGSGFFAGIKEGFNRFFGSGSYGNSLVGQMRANPELAQLMTPRNGSPLLAPGIMARLEAHAKAGGSAISGQQIREFAAAGERIAAALAQATPEEAQSGRLNVDGVEVKSSVFTTRALMWHVMTQGACLDQERGIEPGSANSSMVDSGAIVMNDPDNKLYGFLNAAPTSYGRVSSHFRERAEPDAGRFFGKPVQRGIDDYQNLLPGHGSALLFDRIRPSADAIKAGRPDTPQLFIKFESSGTPPFWRVSESHEGLSHSVKNAFSAIGRCIAHTFSFIKTRSPESNASEGVVRQEHVYKGRLKESVAEPYAAALGRLRDEGIIDKAQEKSLLKEVKKHGLPRIETRLGELLSDTRVRQSGAADTLNAVRTAIAQSNQELGNDYGIERRGVEVHLSYLPITHGAEGFMHEIALD